LGIHGKLHQKFAVQRKFIICFGGKEAENGSVALRSRKEGELGEVNVDAVVEKLSEEVKMRAL
jgi:threonyl-tRNA synthetase